VYPRLSGNSITGDRRIGNGETIDRRSVAHR
jgi:hypothetical protein